MERAREILHKYYGYERFKPIQERAIQSILQGRDTFVIMPTGGGKSLCYQIPAMIFSGLTVVISPLISLMKDQVDSLVTMGIKAAFINSTLSLLEYQEVKQQLLAQNIDILYVAPERLSTPDFLYLMDKLDIAFVAIDEAHCVSQWGHDFRPSYRQIDNFIARFSKRPVVAAFTATATPVVRQDIVAQMQLQSPNIYRASFNRANLELLVSHDTPKEEVLLNFLQKHKGEAGIIYCATRKEVERLSKKLADKGWSSSKYHGGLTDEERKKNQEDFVYDRSNIMIATNAFGMGINKSNVRFVVHQQMPKNLESYYQEIGRAGRDGLPSVCLLLYSGADIHINKFLIKQSVEDEERLEQEYKKLQQMIDYARCTTCLRKYILKYFGEEGKENCQNCSNCNPEGHLAELSAEYLKEEIENSDLLEKLKILRLAQAIKASIPSYMVFSDATLQDMCRKQPLTLSEMLRVSGVGERKCEQYGELFLQEILAWRQEQGLSIVADGRSRNAKTVQRRKAGDSARITLSLLQQGKTVQEVAEERSIALATVLGHIEILLEQYDFQINWGGLYDEDLAKEIKIIVADTGYSSLRLIRELLQDKETPYDMMKIALLQDKLDEQ
ncbi:MAG: RecQ family ATP-dependent DNA helicase [Peptococcaceae bacterium]|nr:RecQ family ATP-dependent DNA helicase [Peptococcaceae bacterium]